jgi:DUF1365 family protein
MNSTTCFYEGTVRHRRFATRAHAFRYRLFLVYLDLSDVPRLAGRFSLWSTRWPAVARFCRTDHLGDPQRTLTECVRDLVNERLGWRPTGPVRLLTSFRYFGFQMNPVSFFYCFHPDGTTLQALVAEVTNTPWNERHCYVIDTREHAAGKRITAEHSKEFHVSPFFGMEMAYHWRFRTPDDQLLLRIDTWKESVFRIAESETCSVQRLAEAASSGPISSDDTADLRGDLLAGPAALEKRGRLCSAPSTHTTRNEPAGTGHADDFIEK